MANSRQKCALRATCKFQHDLTNSIFKENLFSSSEQDSKDEETEKINEEGEAPKDSEAVTPTAAAEGNEETAASEEKEGGQGNEEEAVAQDANADEKDEGMTQLSKGRIICGLMATSCLFSLYGYGLHQKQTLVLLCSANLWLCGRGEYGWMIIWERCCIPWRVRMSTSKVSTVVINHTSHLYDHCTWAEYQSI